MTLVFNIFTNDIGGYFVSYTPNEVSVIPQLMRPKLFPQFGIFLKHFSGRYAFHYLHNLRRSIARRSFDKKVHMIFHHFHDIYTKLILFRYLLEDFFHVSSHLSIKYVLPIFGYPYQMILKIIDSVLGTSYPHAVFYNSFSIALTRPLIALRLGRFHPLSKLGVFRGQFYKLNK
jgi:hypothetical protein